jgi:DNA-binding MarR family transcriptional regulator/N-acetylglutamate synthase-like GNAT family acetyltransferase
MQDTNSLDHHVETVRRFNRFYTQRIGVLHEGLLSSPFSLTEVRILYEITQHQSITASELVRELGLDAGYLSRILSSFKKRGLIARKPSASDRRQNLISLTEKGHKTFAPLNARSQSEVSAILNNLSPENQNRLVKAMQTVHHILDDAPESKAPYILRSHQPGDMGWVVHRHGVLYFEEYGWDERFEALVAGIVADFIKRFDPKKERCWIAEKDGQVVGCVFLVKKSQTVAKLRLLLVEPDARGLGLGKRLVSECERFARQVGYKKIMLWTNNVLSAARHIYESAGYRLIHQEPHHSFGQDLIGETWELKL